MTYTLWYASAIAYIAQALVCAAPVVLLTYAVACYGDWVWARMGRTHG